MKPTIGITISMKGEDVFFIYRDYIDAVVQAGGIPLLLPITKDITLFQKIADKIDGLLLTGGGDIDPSYFNEEPTEGLGEVHPLRDAVEFEIIGTCIKKGKPIFGICRGCQILTVFFGGDLYQDLTSVKTTGIQHTQNSPRYHPTHSIAIKSDSILYSITKKTVIKVNSFHHQAARNVVSPLQVSAKSSDDVIEAVEGDCNGVFILGVQWHPERMSHVCEDSRNIFRYFITKCIGTGINGK